MSPILMVAVAVGGWMGAASDQWVVYDGGDGPGRGKHVVLISGDEEYRSEEALPQLGRILARHHGFKCTVLFAVNPEDGTIDPEVVDNIPGLQALETADLMIIATRFRELPDSQMKYIDDYVESGRPIIGMRTATHAFRYGEGSTSEYRHYDFQSESWEQGFGRQVLGETWIAHHGRHGVESTRGVVVETMKDHPVVRGCEDIWGPSDVYTVRLPLPGGSQALVLGQELSGMSPDDSPVVERASAGGEPTVHPNDPMMPVAWIKSYTSRSGKTGRAFTTTMGAAEDLASEGLRRLLVNAAYWGVGMEEQIPARARVDLVGDFQPSPFGFGTLRKGLKPAGYALEP